MASAVAADGTQYGEGMKAIHESRWAEASGIFGEVAKQQGAHTDGALYWMAYAESKLGHTKEAIDTCIELPRRFPMSSWIDECGALEIEVLANTGKPLDPTKLPDDDLKLLALNKLMNKDEDRALDQIEEIITGDGTLHLKQGALYLLRRAQGGVDEPQIVRISYVEGDVRVARGLKSSEGRGDAWEKAVVNLPIETGYILATGEGRAEIELEDASVIELAPNSALTFNDLHTFVGVPYSEMALLTGTASLDVHPNLVGDTCVLKTLTDQIVTTFPSYSRMRVDSYLDAMAITSSEITYLHLPNGKIDTVPTGQTTYYRDTKLIDYKPAGAAKPMGEWDQWVAARIQHRNEAVAEVMKESGLKTPIPGLAEMKDQGRFFDCQPYGKCWEPTARANASSGQFASPVTQGSLGIHGAVGRMSSYGLPVELEEEDMFYPCLPENIRSLALRNRATGAEFNLGSESIFEPDYPWAWAICHAGGWVHDGRHYQWAAGHRRHHHCPVHWVKSGHTVAYVPVHPHDVKGALPINRKNGLFGVDAKGGRFLGHIQPRPGSHPIESLRNEPRELRNEPPRMLAHIGDPHLDAHQLHPVVSARPGAIASASVPLHFDSHSRSFSMTQQVTVGNRTTVVNTPMNNRGGDLQIHSGGGGFGGGYSGGGRGSGFSGGGHVSGGFSGGGHGGGSSGGGRGGSSGSSGGGYSGGGHGGGSSGSSSGGSQSSSSSSSSSSSTSTSSSSSFGGSSSSSGSTNNSQK